MPFTKGVLCFWESRGGFRRFSGLRLKRGKVKTKKVTELLRQSFLDLDRNRLRGGNQSKGRDLRQRNLYYPGALRSRKSTATKEIH